MENKIVAPFLSYNYIQKKANKFLEKYHPKGSYLLPIEKIVEINFQIYITGIPGLLDVLEIDGWLASNLKEIYVDKDMYEKRPPRYNFTLAHEIGHFVLHPRIYKKNRIYSVEDWKEFIENFPEKQLNWFEWQARAFAGLILVPSSHLGECCNHYIK